jgi:pyruvate,water dikinase
VTAPSVSATLPVPADFPITWEHPDDERAFWMQDLMHNPTPVTPLTASIEGPAFTVGMERALADKFMPILGVRHAHFNHYTYLSPIPFIGTPEEMAARQEKMQARLGEILPTILQKFYAEQVPHIVAISEGLRAKYYDAMTLAEAAAEVARLVDVRTELWDLHMQINIPPMGGAFGLEEFLKAVLGPEAEKLGRLMLGGFPNKSIETGHQFWLLAQQARRDPALVRTLMETPANRLDAALEATPSGREFLAAWNAFLEVYGFRGGGFEFMDPSWYEDRTQPLNSLRGFLASEAAEDPIAGQHRQAAERDRIIAEVEAKLPPPVVPVFRQILAGAQTYLPIAEDHNFYIDQGSTVSFRWPILALGRKLAAAGRIDAVDDVFFLEIAEIAAIAGGDRSDLRPRIRERRASYEHFKGVVPAEALGTPPPADVPPDPLVTKFFGFGVEPSRDLKQIRGIASSSGVVTGTVKVVRRLDEADKLEPGDILVCHMTMPAWTPLFAFASAVVADSGGVLSHCSIVAREYGIPCVTGTRIGTRVLKDGQQITVDGDRGIVRLT